METPPHAVYFTRHSRARGNPGLFTAELAWIPAFAGMTESRRFIRFAEHLPICILKGGAKDTKVVEDRGSRIEVRMRNLRSSIFRPRFSIHPNFVLFVPSWWSLRD